MENKQSKSPELLRETARKNGREREWKAKRRKHDSRKIIGEDIEAKGEDQRKKSSRETEIEQ